MTVDPETPQFVSVLLAQLLANGDIDGVLALYEPNAVFVELDGVARTRSQIRAAHERFIADGLSLMLHDCVSFECEDIALVHWSWSVHRSDGSTMEGTTAEVLRRQPDGRWKFIIDNSDGASVIGVV